MKHTFLDKTLDVKRYPSTTNRSLQPWNAADEHLLKHLKEVGGLDKKIAISNDRFGVLATALAATSPINVVAYKSQIKALSMNLARNEVANLNEPTYSPLDELPSFQIALLKVPKSMDLFRLLLQQLHKTISDDGQVLCGFMTKHFSSSMLEIASDYFEVSDQSKAWKKSRILQLSGKKEIQEASNTQTISYQDRDYNQYLGVFSGNHIDYATQFLLEHLKIKENEQTVLDLASGNGVIGAQIQAQNSDIELHLLDDSYLAVESSKLNMSETNASFHYNDTLDDFKPNYFDLIASNPPFHLEHENNIEVTLGLFKQAHECLKPNGRFCLVASQHLNFKTHLEVLFPKTTILKENDKFVIYECIK